MSRESHNAKERAKRIAAKMEPGSFAAPTGSASECQMTIEPFFQCCHACIYLRPVHYHCCTEPKPTEEQKKAAGIEGRCVCGVQKGWACVGPETDRVYDNWPQHSSGCECYTAKTPNTEVSSGASNASGSQ